MELQELKNTIAVIESTQKNIDGWNAFRNREIAIIPVDSKYYKEFEEWKKTKGSCYDGEKEKSPMYINGKNTNEVLDLMIKHQEDFAKPHKEKLASVLTTTQAE